MDQAECGRMTSMQQSDQLKCAAGREVLYRLQQELTFNWMSSAILPSTRCEVPQACRAICVELESKTMDRIPRVRALESWIPDGTHRLCAKCERVGRIEFHIAREIVWSKLPAAFDLTDWESVMTDQALSVSFRFSLLIYVEDILISLGSELVLLAGRFGCSG